MYPLWVDGSGTRQININEMFSVWRDSKNAYLTIGNSSNLGGITLHKGNGSYIDIKTAVSEAVSNAVIHGYDSGDGEVELLLEADDNEVRVRISDKGVGIPDIALAREPLYTTKSTEDRSGMGFYFMETFMDSIEVESVPGKGTTIIMKKSISGR
jgi:stage II sporulation protein AB (anti-sigma F factor)